MRVATHPTAERDPIYNIHGRPLAYQGSVVTLGVIPERTADEGGLLNALSLVLALTAALANGGELMRPTL